MATEEKKVEKVEKVEKFSFIAVHGGPMLNPLTEDRFTSEPSKPVAFDWWIKVQVEAGKMAKAPD